MNNADLPAMPIGEQIDGVHLNPICNGLTKREYFAGLAMQGILANEGYNASMPDVLIEEAISQADELLKALEENK